MIQLTFLFIVLAVAFIFRKKIKSLLHIGNATENFNDKQTKKDVSDINKKKVK